MVGPLPLTGYVQLDICSFQLYAWLITKIAVNGDNQVYNVTSSQIKLLQSKKGMAKVVLIY